ncbi:MAG TPA: YidB family protein [Acidiphilium sp.]
MGLFDEISGAVGDALGGGQGSGAGGMAGQLMGALQENGISGISGLAQQFEQNGLGGHIASWIGNGDNLPVSADQIQQALGSPMVASIAQKLGIDPQAAAQLIAKHLPAAVDAATPDGTAQGAS